MIVYIDILFLLLWCVFDSETQRSCYTSMFHMLNVYALIIWPTYVDDDDDDDVSTICMIVAYFSLQE